MKPSHTPLKLGLKPLSLEDVYQVAVEDRKVILAPVAVKRVKEARTFLLKQIQKGEVLYGVNTGFGLMSNVRIADDQIETLQYNLLRSHACGMGDALEEPYVRAMMLLRASALAQGHSGVSLGLVNRILALMNARIHPVIPSQGSVGASGDLAPLSHLALVLIGEGKANVPDGKSTKVVSGADALRWAGLEPLRLGPKEGLALINGTQFMTAIGALTVVEAEHLADVADALGAMTVEALRGTATAFSPEIHQVRPHPGQIKTARNLQKLLLDGGKKSRIAQSHEGCGKVQDPYSVRCMPQVHGASRDVFAFVRGILEREANAVTDNPLVFPKQKKILSGGNFHGQIVAIALDTLAIAVAELGSISEQRIEKLINPAISELPAFLAQNGGLNSGFMIVQVAAASIVSENKTLCHPASVDSIATSADKEDHVSMGAWAAVKGVRVLNNVRKVLAMEMLSCTQGLEFLRPLKSTKVLEKIHQQVRKQVPFATQDRAFHEDLVRLDRWIASRALKPLLDEVLEN